MFRLTLIVNSLVPALLISLLWIECKNTAAVGTPDTMSIVTGLLFAIAPYCWLSVLAYRMQEQTWAMRLTGCASILTGTLALLILGTNTTFRPALPGDVYENMAPPIVLIGQCVATAIATPFLLFVFFLCRSKSENGKTD
jgi:Na+(H+)/acetate symporter ActP